MIGSAMSSSTTVAMMSNARFTKPRSQGLTEALP
jgi:hypothetical protein